MACLFLGQDLEYKNASNKAAMSELQTAKKKEVESLSQKLE